MEGNMIFLPPYQIFCFVLKKNSKKENKLQEIVNRKYEQKLIGYCKQDRIIIFKIDTF